MNAPSASAATEVTHGVREVNEKPWGTMLFVAAVMMASIVWTIWLAKNYPYGFNPDGFSYIDLADSWSEGRWRDAINGYWSILFPLLLAPLRLIGLSANMSFALVGALSSAASLLLVFLVGQRLAIHRVFLGLFTVVVAIIVPIRAVELRTPDQLFLTVGLLSVLFALGVSHDAGRMRWFVFGLSCGLLFLAKPVGLLTGGVFAVYVWMLWCNLGSSERRSSIIRLAMVLLGYAVLVLPTVLLLSWKYDQFTSGSSSAYNLALTQDRAFSHPMFEGLWEAPFVGAVSVWTDPTMMDFRLPFSIFSHSGIDLVTANMSVNIEVLWQELDTSIFLAGFGLLAILVIGYRSRAVPRQYAIILGAGVIHALVYLPVVVETRYMMLSVMLVAISSVGLARQLIASRSAAVLITGVVTIVACASLMAAPIDIALGRTHPLDFVRYRNTEGEHIQAVVEELDLGAGVCTRLVANPHTYFTYQTMLHLADTSNAVFLGFLQPEWSDEETNFHLRDYQADCLVVWPGASLPVELTLREISRTEDDGIIVYRVYP